MIRLHLRETPKCCDLASITETIQQNNEKYTVLKTVLSWKSPVKIEVLLIVNTTIFLTIL